MKKVMITRKKTFMRSLMVKLLMQTKVMYMILLMKAKMMLMQKKVMLMMVTSLLIKVDIQ